MDIERYIELFSKERIEGYKSIEEHNNNLRLISELTSRLAVIELIVRNRIDKRLKQEDSNWIESLRKELESAIKNPKSKDYRARTLNKIKKEMQGEDFLTNDQLVSRLSFGFWVDFSYYLLKQKKWRCEDILDTSSMKFRKYANLNKHITDDTIKLGFVLKLIQRIRNRAFHWENLLKMSKTTTKKNEEIKIPSIYITMGKISIGIAPENIKIFINDVLEILDEEIFEEYKFPLWGASRT